MRLPRGLRPLLRPVSRRVMLEWVPALRRSRPLNQLHAARHSLVLARSPESSTARVALGRALLHLGHSDDALAHWEDVLARDPDQLELYHALGHERCVRGEWAAAMETICSGVERQHALADDLRLSALGVRLLGAEWTGMIGHTALLDVYAKTAILADVPLDSRALVIDPTRIANPAYLGYWRRLFPLVVDHPEGARALNSVSRYLGERVSVFQGIDGAMRTLYQAAFEAEQRWRAEGRPPLLQLSAEDDERGRAALEALGMPRDAWFVGLHVRSGPPPYRDVHNAGIATYDQAIAAITDRGGWVVRMGDSGMPRLRPRERVIDYAHSHARQDWLDVFLWARCRFFVGTQSGPSTVPATFGVPCVHTNDCPLAFRHWSPDDLAIPKRYYSEPQRRYVTVGEALSGTVGYALSSRHLALSGVRVEDNTPDELREVVIEMLDRTDGGVTYSEEDERLYAQFEALHPQGAFAHRGACRVGRDWLRRNADLLV